MVYIRLIGEPVRIDQPSHAFVLLIGIGTTHQHTRHRGFHAIGGRQTMVGMLRTAYTEPRHITIARGIAPKQIVGILKSITAIAPLLHITVGIEQRQSSPTTVLGKTAPAEIACLIAKRRLETRCGHLGYSCLCILAQLSQQHLPQVTLRRRQPRIDSQSCHIAPSGHREAVGHHGAHIGEIALVGSQQIQFGSRPEPLIACIVVSICTRVDGRLVGLVHLILLIVRIWMSQRPLVSTTGCLLCLRREQRIVGVTTHQSCRKGHNGRKVERGSDTLGHHIAELMTVGWTDKCLKIGGCELMIYTSVRGVLHGEHPAQVEHHLVQQVGRRVTAFWDMCVQPREIVFILLVGMKHEPYRESGVDDIFIVVACIIPTQRRLDETACRATFRRCRGMYHHQLVGMASPAGVHTGIVSHDRRTATHQVEELECSHRQFMIGMGAHAEVGLHLLSSKSVSAWCPEGRDIDHGALLARPGRDSHPAYHRTEHHLAYGIGHLQRGIGYHTLYNYNFFFARQIAYLIVEYLHFWLG